MKAYLHEKSNPIGGPPTAVELPDRAVFPEVVICGSQVFRHVGPDYTGIYFEVRSYAILESLDKGGALVTEII